jgi:peptidoglycan/xylan/chitin deacetylase (PgdA/CDA1 family)
MLSHRKTTLKLLSNGLFVSLCLLLAACLGQPTPTAPAISLVTPQVELASATPIPPVSTLAPLPTDTQVDSPTPFQPASPTVTLTPTQIVPAAHIPIIEYHYSEYNVGNTVMMKTEWFESQMAWLADNGFTTLSAADVIAYLNGAVFPQKSVILSFDLGTARRDNFTTVIIPTLQKYNFKGLFFLLVNDGVISDTCDNSGKFCWDDLRQWQQEGIASIESHGLTHPDYATLTVAEMRWDAGQAFKIISAKLGTPPLAFAYPFDSVPTAAPAVIKSLGYQFAVGGYTRYDRTVEVMDADRYSLPRVYPYSNMTIYPVIGGSKGKTYDQMVTDLIMGAGILPTPVLARTATLTSSPTLTSTP